MQLVYSSFGAAKNARLFASTVVQDATIAGLVALAKRIGVDGIDVDVEQLDAGLVPAYGAFVGRLRDALRTAMPAGQVSVATGAGRQGAAMAVAATAGGADRIFLMGYDYHYASSDTGASAPMARRDGAEADLPWSLDLYEALGVPVQRTILGLPLYGMRWRVAGPGSGRAAARRRGDLGPGRQPEVPRLPTAPARARPDRGGRVLRGRPDGQPASRRFAGDRRLAGDLRRFPADPHAKAPARRRPGSGGRRVLGDRLRTRSSRLQRAHREIRGGKAEIAFAGTLPRPIMEPP